LARNCHAPLSDGRADPFTGEVFCLCFPVRDPSGALGQGGGPGQGGAPAEGGGPGLGGAPAEGGAPGQGGSGGCDAGSTTTAWATECSATRVSCTAGTWRAWGSSSPENYPLRFETEHFAFYWPDGRAVTEDAARSAADYMETVLWNDYLNPPINWPEPYCDTADKLKTSVHIIESGLYGGLNVGPGIWVGPGAMADHWGLGHEWMHALQALTPTFPDCGSPCWIYESHANFMPHQLDEGRSDVHCSEMLVNAPHVYYDHPHVV